MNGKKFYKWHTSLDDTNLTPRLTRIAPNQKMTPRPYEKKHFPLEKEDNWVIHIWFDGKKQIKS
jgi:hypothetical protein